MSRPRRVVRVLTAALLACLACRPAAAGDVTPPVMPRATPSVSVLTDQNVGWGRVTVVLNGSPDPVARPVDGGIELRFPPGTGIVLARFGGLRQVAGVDLHATPDGAIALIRLACDCDAKSTHETGLFHLDIRDRPKVAGAARNASQEASELHALRDTLTAKLIQLNAAAPPVASPATGGSAPAAATAAAAALPACPPSLDLSAWQHPHNFVDELRELRARLARARDPVPELRALAEFYLAHGLANEAFAVASDPRIATAEPAEVRPEDRDRLAVIAAVARLLRREPLDAASPLLAASATCRRDDTGLWRALAAAAAGDADGVAGNADAAGTALHDVPEPLLQIMAFRIADAAGDNLPALRAMAAAVRNANIGLPEDEAARFLLQARMARADGDAADELVFLEHAAGNDRTIPGMVAKARLAALRTADQGPLAAHAEAVLADFARTYRYETLGQDAADQYAEARLRQGDYVSALEIADESAGPAKSRPRESRGASLAARILRTLLVDRAAGPPDQLDRLALYWRYEGYATPGERGDDIRLGAARTMLGQGFAGAVLEVLGQLSDGVAATAPAQLLRAAATSRAGDPALALALLRTLPTGDEQRRIAADALARLGRPADAAAQLDGMADAVDRTRRAALLYDAAAWDAAAGAYANLLLDTGLTGIARREALDRYGLALSLAGQTPAAGLPRPDEPPSAWLAVAQIASGANPAAAVTAARDAIERARRIETLLDPATTAQQGS